MAEPGLRGMWAHYLQRAGLPAGHGLLVAAASLQEGRALGRTASAVVNTSLVALKHVDSLQTRIELTSPYIGRQTLNHWTTNEVPMPTCKIRFVFAVGLCELLTYCEY